MKQHHRLGLWTPLAGVLIFTLSLSAVLAASAPAVVGDWEGALYTGNGSLRVVVHIDQAKDDSLTGTLDSPDQGATGIAITSIGYAQPDLHFDIRPFGSSFDGKINKENSEIAGQWKQSGASLPLTFKRVAK
jgi:uncharacterized protein